MYKILLISLLLGHSFILAQTNEPLLSVAINVSNGNNSTQLYVGIDNTATDGIDNQLGEAELPPLPPNGVFDVRLIGTNIGVQLYNGSLKDYRQGNYPLTQTKTHEIFIQRATTDAVKFSWDFPAGVTGILQDFFGGIAIDVSMSGTGSYDLTNPLLSDLKLTMAYDIISGLDRTSLLEGYHLYQNFPNPFNPTTKIRYQIPQKANVRISLYDITGQELMLLVNEEKETGSYELILDANDLSSGAYFYRLTAGEFIETKKMILLK